MEPPATRSSVSPVEPLAALIGLVCGCLLAVILLLTVAIDQVGRQSSEREQVQLASALSAAVDELRERLGSVTQWDESLARTRSPADAADLVWFHEEVAAWLATNFDVNEVYLLDARQRPLYAMVGGERTAPQRFAARADVALPLVAEAARELGAPERIMQRSPIDTTRGPDRATYALLEGELAIVVAAKFTPDVASPAIAVRDLPTIVVVRRIDADVIAALAERIQISPPLLAPGSTEPLIDTQHAHLQIRDWRGQPLAQLHWPFWQPMRGLTKSLIGPVIVALALVLVSSTTALYLVRRSRRQLSDTLHKALHDELTGLPNRRLLSEQLEATLQAGSECALLFLDLDRFKEVNDVWGHDAGDQILQVTAARLKEIAEDGLVARFGGDEFVMLLRNYDVSAAEDLATTILVLLRRPHHVAGTMMTLGGSVGIAATAGEAMTADELLRRADLALYEAKARGKNRHVAFEPSMDDRLQARRAIENALSIDIADERLQVLYQPIVSAADGLLVGVEALSRWHHPELGHVSPSQFIEIAEDAGLIQQLGRQVLHRACADAARWHGITVSINVSPVQVRSHALIDEIGAALAQSGLAPHRLTLEITETALINDRELAKAMFDRLRASGVRLALDDFGTGYSSLAYLRDFKFDCLKIDHRFAHALARGDLAVLAAIVALGHALELAVIAEGVETPVQRDMLRAAGCDGFQGYYFGYPMTAAEIDAILASRDYRLPRAAA